MKSKLVITLLGVLIFVIFPKACLAGGIADVDNQLVSEGVSLDEKFNKLTENANQNIVNSAQASIDTANLVIGVVALIFGGVAVFGIIGGIVFSSQIKMIDESARASAKNMEFIVNNAKALEKEIKKRLVNTIKLYSELESKEKILDGKMKKLRDVEGKPEEKSRITEIEREITKLKRELTKGIQPYTWSVSGYPSAASVYPGSISTTTSTSTSSFGTTSPSATTTTTLPYYPSPSASPSPEPEDDETDK